MIFDLVFFDFQRAMQSRRVDTFNPGFLFVWSCAYSSVVCINFLWVLWCSLNSPNRLIGGLVNELSVGVCGALQWTYHPRLIPFHSASCPMTPRSFSCSVFPDVSKRQGILFDTEPTLKTVLVLSDMHGFLCTTQPHKHTPCSSVSAS